MSSPYDLIDIDVFKQQVCSTADHLEAVWTGYDLRTPLGAVASDEKNQVIEEVLNQVYEDATEKPEDYLGSPEEIRVAALEVRSALQTPSIRSTICRLLLPLTGKSTREIVVEITKVCLPLAIAGQLTLPASPLVWAILGFTVATIGTTWLCSPESRTESR
jgi:hypothetical protein